MPEWELEFFDWASGRHLGRVNTLGRVTSAVSREDRLWLGGVNPEGMNALGIGSMPHSQQGDIGQQARIALNRVQMSRPYVESDLVRNLWTWTSMDVGPEDIVISFGASPFLLRTSLEGEVLDTIPLLAGTRRGVPADDDFMAMMNLDGVSTPEEYEERREQLIRAASLLTNVSRTEHGGIIVVHIDGERDGASVWATLYVSSIGQDGRRQCVDTVVPTSKTGRPIAAFHGDRLFVLDQRPSEGAEVDGRMVVRAFTVDPDRCTGQVLASH